MLQVLPHAAVLGRVNFLVDNLYNRIQFSTVTALYLLHVTLTDVWISAQINQTINFTFKADCPPRPHPSLIGANFGSDGKIERSRGSSPEK